MLRSFSGVFLTIEGIEGVGKSTAVKFIQDCLTEVNKPCLLTREPGGTDIAEQIRNVLLTPNQTEVMLPETELLLMFASRVQHVQHVILPALQAGKWVICDRFVDASFAYQGGGRQINPAHIEMLDQWLVGNVQPTATILLDAPPTVGLERAKHRGPHDRIEQEKVDFFERVRAVYLARAKANEQRYHIIDANQALALVQSELKKVVNELL